MSQHFVKVMASVSTTICLGATFVSGGFHKAKASSPLFAQTIPSDQCTSEIRHPHLRGMPAQASNIQETLTFCGVTDAQFKAVQSGQLQVKRNLCITAGVRTSSVGHEARSGTRAHYNGIYQGAKTLGCQSGHGANTAFYYKNSPAGTTFLGDVVWKYVYGGVSDSQDNPFQHRCDIQYVACRVTDYVTGAANLSWTSVNYYFNGPPLDRNQATASCS